MKPNDLIGIRACHTCHDWLDRRDGGDPDQDRYGLILAGLIRTLDALVTEGIIDP